MNTGSIASTDSRTPRMLRTVSPRIRKISTPNLAPWSAGGTKLNRASPAAAIDTVIVRT